VSHTHGVDSEVGQLRTVLTHRPGPELTRITPRAQADLPFARLPWLERARQEHDTFTESLRELGAEVLYVTELLQDCLEYLPARGEAIAAALAGPRLGEQLRTDLRCHLSGLDPEALAQVLVAGLSVPEFRAGRGVVYGLLGRHDFVIPPLPNLVFTKDSSVWTGRVVTVASLPGTARQRECALVRTIYRHHPRFTGTTCLYRTDPAWLDGGDIIQLAPGVVAAGVGERTTAAAVERLARHLFAAGAAHIVLAVPTGELPAATRFDTVCTVVGDDTVLMSPAIAYTLQAHAITAEASGSLRISPARPFLQAAADAMGAGALHVISTGTHPAMKAGRQGEDGGNVLAVAPRVVISYERNTATIARLEAAGVTVIRVPGSELASGRGGPRCMASAASRDPVAAAAQSPAASAPPPSPRGQATELPAARIPALATNGHGELAHGDVAGLADGGRARLARVR
jgi:arginine deiminase